MILSRPFFTRWWVVGLAVIFAALIFWGVIVMRSSRPEPEGAIATSAVRAINSTSGLIVIALNNYGESHRADGLEFYGGLSARRGECFWEGGDHDANIEFRLAKRATFRYEVKGTELKLWSPGFSRKLGCTLRNGTQPEVIATFHFSPERWLDANDEIDPVIVTLPVKGEL